MTLAPREFEIGQLWEHHPDGLALLERQPLGMTRDEQLVIVKVNPAMERLFGSRPLIGQPAEVLVPSSRLSATDSGIFPTFHANGSSFPITSSLVEMAPPHDLLIIRDFTLLSATHREIPDHTSTRIADVEVREQAIGAQREALTQHLFAAGIALQLCARAKAEGPEVCHEHVDRAISLLDGVINDLMSWA